MVFKGEIQVYNIWMPIAIFFRTGLYGSAAAAVVFCDLCNSLNSGHITSATRGSRCVGPTLSLPGGCSRASELVVGHCMLSGWLWRCVFVNCFLFRCRKRQFSLVICFVIEWKLTPPKCNPMFTLRMNPKTTGILVVKNCDWRLDCF